VPATKWHRELGGFRKPRPDSPNGALRHQGFRGYADYIQSEPFRTALAVLLKEAADSPTAIMCSETLWWRCHRRLVADALVLLHGVEVEHLLHSGTPQPHRLTPGVRLLDNQTLQYDGLDQLGTG
jgi:uncharacterized protein (DUF488 family)